MQIINIQHILRLIVLFGSVAGFTSAFNAPARAEDNKAPELPPLCQTLRVEDGNKVSFRVYAIGVQIYRWNGASWDFVAPAANLYSNSDFHGKVGSHYAGPTWESNSGSRVIGSRVDGCTPDQSAIPWLLLRANSVAGPGVFKNVTFIQRVNTTGGLRPTSIGLTVGEEKRVPYTAEYFFYRAQ